jgi:hypothetical protein
MNTYTDDDVNLSLSEIIDREIIRDMDTVCNKFSKILAKLPNESIEPLFLLLGRDDKGIEYACNQVLMVLDYSTEELPLHVNDGGIVEAATVWRLRYGI